MSTPASFPPCQWFSTRMPPSFAQSPAGVAASRSLGHLICNSAALKGAKASRTDIAHTMLQCAGVVSGRSAGAGCTKVIVRSRPAADHHGLPN